MLSTLKRRLARTVGSTRTVRDRERALGRIDGDSSRLDDSQDTSARSTSSVSSPRRSLVLDGSDGRKAALCARADRLDRWQHSVPCCARSVRSIRDYLSLRLRRLRARRIGRIVNGTTRLKHHVRSDLATRRRPAAAAERAAADRGGDRGAPLPPRRRRRVPRRRAPSRSVAALERCSRSVAAARATVGDLARRDRGREVVQVPWPTGRSATSGVSSRSAP